MNDRSRLKDLAGRLRHDQTDTEQLMWSQLCAKRSDGFKFRRQYPIGEFILDFDCSRPKLNSGHYMGQHLEAQQRPADQAPDAILAGHGITAFQFDDRAFFTARDEVINESWETLMRSIEQKTPLRTAPRVRGTRPEKDAASQSSRGGIV